MAPLTVPRDRLSVKPRLNRHQKPALRETGLPAFGSMLRLRGWVGQSIQPRGR